MSLFFGAFYQRRNHLKRVTELSLLKRQWNPT